MNQARRETPAGVVAAFCAGWSIFLPIGVKYPLLLGAAVWGLWQLRQPDSLLRLRKESAPGWALRVWAWSALTALWSTGPWQEAAAQVGLYSLLLCVPVIGHHMSPGWAHRALRHFCIAAGVVGGLFWLDSLLLLPAPDAWIWRSTVSANGNQRIVTSLLLALGCALALREAVLARLHPHGIGATLAWGAVACTAAVGLASQDRRTGMVVLPVLLMLLGIGLVLAPHVSLTQRATRVLGVALCCFAVGLGTPSVRERFAEGFGEIARYTATSDVADSWGMRLRMAEQSLQMATERPVTGHGLGSWTALWVQRVPPASLLAEQRTPHNEYLLVAVQTGLPGVALLLAAIWTHGLRGFHNRPFSVAPASLLVWGALAWAGLFNVVLRDAKFAVPLLMLAALAWSCDREQREH